RRRSGSAGSARSTTSSPSSAPIRAGRSASRKGRMAVSAEAAGPSHSPLGIIAGNGGVPRRIIERCQAVGREVFVLALEGEADPSLVAAVPHAWCRIGGAAAGLDTLRAHAVGELLLAGGVR